MVYFSTKDTYYEKKDSKMTEKYRKILHGSSHIGMIVIGNFLLAAGTAFFVIPLDLVTAGTTGIALFIYRLSGFSISLFTYLFYTASYAVGCIFLGRRFALTTLISSLWYPIAFSICENLARSVHLTSDRMLGTLAAGLMIGVGIGLVLRTGASTGGTDVPLLILHKYLRLPLTTAVWILDLAILVLQCITSTTEDILYGALLVTVYSLLIGRMLVLGQSKMQATVISENPSKLRDAIFREIDRGVTLLYGETGYRERTCKVLFTVFPTRELGRIERIVAEVDPKAFLIVHRVSKVRGFGFMAHGEQ